MRASIVFIALLAGSVVAHQAPHHKHHHAKHAAAKHHTTHHHAKKHHTTHHAKSHPKHHAKHHTKKPAHSKGSGSSGSSGTHLTSSGGGSFTLKNDLKGQGFIDFFDFAEGANDNGGTALYVNKQEAQSNGLIYVNGNGNVHIGVETTGYVSNTRKAVKLTSQENFNGGLFILNVKKLPAVCGVWPAFWFVSDQASWPQGGEIDVVEYVNEQSANAFSTHTSSGCSMKSSGFQGSLMLPGGDGTNCDTSATNAQGCGIRSSNIATAAGPGANSAGGATYALHWNAGVIQMWNFDAGSVPGDISSKNPNPANWGTPQSQVTSATCDILARFTNHVAILNTNLCGTWPEGVWNSDNSYAGQAGSCASKTGFSSCQEYVRNKGGDFANAGWEVESLQIYQ